MSQSPLQVRISTPTEPVLPGRGFYQLEEEALYVQIGPFSKQRRFFSYIESEYVRLDFDRHGRLIFLEVSLPRRQWPTAEQLTLPDIVEVADVRWLAFRTTTTDPTIVSAADKSLLRLTYVNTHPLRNYYLAEAVIAQVNDSNQVATIWITDIVDDMAGRAIAAFRKSLRKSNATVG